jgi:hypothetical protein
MERGLARPIAKELQHQRRAVVAEAGKELPDFELLWEEFRSRMIAALIPPLINIYDQAAARSFGEVLARKDFFGDLLTHARRWAAIYAKDLVQGVTNTTRVIVANALSTVASTPGMTLGDFKDMVNRAFSPERVQSIAITEATRAHFEGTRDTQSEMNKLGFRTQLIWFTVNDDRVCVICQALEGKAETAPGSGVWDADGVIVTQPAHTGCRCRTGAEAIA